MKHESSKSALFLMELILAVLFFALASAVCARLFVAAHLISRDTREASRAAVLTQSAAACVQSAQGDFDTAAPLLSGETDADGSLVVFYDEVWQPAAQETAAYRLTVTPDEGERAVAALARVDGSVVFELTFGWHVPLLAGKEP